ncbi:hypothetical protein SERLADRAFT_436899 [Serpula lacrymans var. lacrymans S7.9]|uniref:Uncharacterized protein n=1 Tax=Serpula lacrymans var. lacrymans (strain S7.9) TaxID=578457 RepID=F8NU09_SERL9|nr:uncharacterized protein SERLADRAFT_436899 [Serpula lacrymans var. lacrymans S7.9]EGO25136.1 hypothetical protein SERLADRAFT_436899 [Serpula lacrymans var. lacrymans S7.9]
MNKNGKITHYTYQRIDAGGQNRFTKFLLTGLDREDVLLGFPWLRKVNPVINWKDKELPNLDKHSIRMNQTTTETKIRTTAVNEDVYETIHRYVSDQTPYPRTTIRLKVNSAMEHAQIHGEKKEHNLLDEYKGYSDVFDKKKSERLPK